MGEQTVIIVERSYDYEGNEWDFSGVFANLDSASVKLSKQYGCEVVWVPENGKRVGVERSWGVSLITRISHDTLYFRAYEMIPMDLMGRHR